MKQLLAKRFLGLAEAIINEINQTEIIISEGLASTVKCKLVEGILAILYEPEIFKKYGAKIKSLEYIIASEEAEGAWSQSDELRHIPYDEYELKKCNELILKEAEFVALLRRIEKEIDIIFENKLIYNHTLIDKALFGKLFLKIFLLNLENRPFKTEDFTGFQAEVIVDGIIKQRNIPCEICGENRATEGCHIVPDALGGHGTYDNLLILCPTHHKLFDNAMLTIGEWDKINWKRKPAIIQKFAFLVFKNAQEKFWATVKSGNFDKMSSLDIKGKDFYVYLINDLLLAIDQNPNISQKELIGKYPIHLAKCIQNILRSFVKENILIKSTSNGKHTYKLKDAIKNDEYKKIKRYL